ncbi:MAG: ELWxxDGT repeat protein, partial [Planctomycetota bacterium]
MRTRLMNFKLLHATGMLLLGFTLTQTLALAQSATLVKDINSGTAAVASSNPWFHSTGAFTYFSATNPTLGTELYKTLGSTGGATLIKDIHPGPGNAFPGSLHTVGSTTYFAASDGKNGRELWKTDGSSAGTVMVKDIVPGAGSSNPAGIVSIGTTIYFILGIPGGKNDIELAVPQPGELWKSDGTAAGTVLVKKFIISTGNVSISPVDGASALLFVMGNTLYLAADDGNGGVGNELWKSDGTTAGTVLVKDIFPGKDTRGNPNSSSIQYFTAYKGKVYFYARNATSDYELWVTDGTSAGTVRVKDIRTGASGSYPRYLTVFGNYFYFSANDGSGYELWQSDGSTAGTVLLKDINQSTGTASSSPYNNDPNTNPATWKFAIMGNAFYFRANDGTNGTELWKSDGTATGTVMVKDINPGTGSGYPQDIVFDGRKTLYFSANSGNGYELWKCDGTTNGTVLVKDINTTTTTASSSPNYLVGVLLGGVVFRANDGVTGYEPWFSDGTANGTKLVADINKAGPGDTGHGYPRYFADVNGTLFFSANDGKTGYELWKSDGTAAGTVMVKDIRPGTNSSSPYYLTAMDGMVYFRANDGGTGNELWKSDGTAAGTVMVKDIRPGTGASSPAYLTFAGHKTLYFTANDGSTGSELWKSDGTAAGTVRVKDIRAGSGSSSPNYF